MRPYAYNMAPPNFPTYLGNANATNASGSKPARESQQLTRRQGIFARNTGAPINEDYGNPPELTWQFRSQTHDGAHCERRGDIVYANRHYVYKQYETKLFPDSENAGALIPANRQ